MAKQLPPIPTTVLGTGTEILQTDGIRASLSYAYNHGAKVALERLSDRVSTRRAVRERMAAGEPAGSYQWGRVLSYEKILADIDNLIKEYTHEA